MENFPQITTARLLLGRISYRDIPKIIEYAGNRKVAETTLNIPHPYREEDAVFWINSANSGFKGRTQYTFAVRRKDSEEFIGAIGLRLHVEFLRAELGYWIAEPFWNQGFATEAAGAVLEFGFKDLQLHKIYATHMVENPASGKVMTKNGMIWEGELKDHTRKGDKFRSIVLYRMIRSEFEQRSV